MAKSDGAHVDPPGLSEVRMPALPLLVGRQKRMIVIHSYGGVSPAPRFASNRRFIPLRSRCDSKRPVQIVPSGG